MKIKSLQFYDYRVFYAEKEEDKDDYIIKLDSKNLLLYGENGSGKSSIYKALKDVVHEIDFEKHFKSNLLDEGFIEIVFDDDSKETITAAGLKTTKIELLGISKLNSFLSYKELLRTHLRDDDEINFFDLIVNEILREHNLQTLGSLHSAWKNLEERNILREQAELEMSIDLDITAEEAREQIEKLKSDYNDEIIKFNDEFDELLDTLNLEIKEILDYFKQGIEMKFELTKLQLDNLSEPELKANVKYAQTDLSSFHFFLNEAKLSAIALSIYLTALKSNPTQGVIKFLFLDDVFLGLDLSNRLPLLDILKKEFSEWQIFLTTYDRHWFEVAKQHLDLTDSWIAKEMYAIKVEGKFFDKPLIIQSDDYYTKANTYFKAGDYPASLNYLRKELEKQITARLPEESTRHYEGRPHQLTHLWELLVERYNRNVQGELITAKIKAELKVARFSLLNPQSHDNLSSPVYKYELQRAIDLIKAIQGIPIINGVTLLASGMELEFKHPDLNYTLTLELLEDWQIDIVGSVKTHSYPNCKLKHWQFGGSDYYKTHNNTPGTKPEKLPEGKLNTVRNTLIGQALLQPLTEETFNANTTFESFWTVKELIEKSDNPKRDNWFCRIFRK